MQELMHIDKLIMYGEIILAWDFGEVFHALAENFHERAIAKKEKVLHRLGINMKLGA